MDCPTIEIRRFPSRAELNASLVQRLDKAIATNSGTGPTIMLSGGSTPLSAYRELASRAPTPAAGLHVLFSDDRYVPSSATQSNYHQALPLLDALALPEESVLRVKTELPLEKAALDYEKRIDSLLLTGASFRLGLLGLGADGHTASLFSADDLNRSRGHRAIAVHRPDGMQAVSVTPEVLALFAELIFVVAGAEKRSAVNSLIHHDAGLAAYGAVASRTNVGLWLSET